MLNRQEYSKQYYIKNREKKLKQGKEYTESKHGQKVRKLYYQINKTQLNKKGYLARKKAIKLMIETLKINGCAICGYDKCNAALVFHHVNPEDKKFNLGNFRQPVDKIVEEINKCILLCANCHREIHWGLK